MAKLTRCAKEKGERHPALVGHPKARRRVTGATIRFVYAGFRDSPDECCGQIPDCGAADPCDCLPCPNLCENACDGTLKSFVFYDDDSCAGPWCQLCPVADCVGIGGSGGG